MLPNKYKINLKYKPRIITGIAIVGFSSLFLFQNCSQQLDQSSFSDMNQAQTINQPHEEGHGPTEKLPLLAIDQVPLLMDRVTLYSVFADILGSNSANLAGMKKLIAQKDIFGGPCSVYNNFRSVSAGTAAAPKADPQSIPCNNSQTANNLSAPIHPNANVLRQAVVNDICMQAKDSATVFSYVHAQLKDQASDPVAANTAENVLKLFSLFYRGKPMPDSGLVDSLQLLVGSPATVAGWKNAFLVTCLSSHWQAL